MMLTVDSVTDSIKEYNEDRCGHSEFSTWVMDGALPLTETHVTDGPSDVIWYVDWWTQYLNDHLDQMDVGLLSLMKDGLKELNRSFSRFTDISRLSKLERACASIGIVRQREDVLECYVLGDIEIVLQMKDGRHIVLTDERIGHLDQEIIEMIAHRPDREDHLVFNGYTAEELEKLRMNRLSMNSPSGYAILEYDEQAIEKGLFKTFKVSEVQSMLLMSDGFSALHNKYDCYTLEELFQVVENKGVTSLIQPLRAYEKVEVNRSQRLRQHDDATAVFRAV